MRTAHADAALAARALLRDRGWIARHAEAFRHLPPPQARVWLGDEAEPAAAGCAAHALAATGWTLHPLGNTAPGRVDARWLDAVDAGQGAELFAGLPLPEAGDAAPFGWAHRALCRHGLRLRIGPAQAAAGGASAAVWLQLRHQPRATVEAPLLVIEVQAGVHCVLVESHEGEPLDGRTGIVQNLQAHIRLGAGATLQHLRIAAPGAGDRIAHHLHARLDRGARYDQALVATGSRYHLQRSEIDLPAAQATARTAGVLFAAGTALEQQVQVSHGAPDTASAVEALVLASGTARTVINAHTRIAPGCDDAAVRQRLSGIPTGGQPRLVLRPHLEINHDQVQATHGATWGALPEEALFYARQRGLDDNAARGLIVTGMARAMLERGLGGPELMQTLAIDALLNGAVTRHLGAGMATEPEAGHE